MKTLVVALLATLTLTVGSLGASTPTTDAAATVTSDDFTALGDALAANPGFLGLAPDPSGAPVLHATFSGDAPAIPEQSVPAGFTLDVHEHADVDSLAIQVDPKDFADRNSDGTAPVPADARGLGPGSPLLIERPDGLFICTANFIFKDTSGNYYLGTAGHCLLPPGAVATHGAGTLYNPSGVSVDVCVDICYLGGQLIGIGDYRTLGSVAYARQTMGNGAAGEDVGWDFGLVRIPTSLEPYMRFSVPVWHGPVGQDGTDNGGEFLAFYGNGIDFGTTFLTKHRAGITLGDSEPESISLGLSVNGGDSGGPVLKAWVTAAGDVYEGRAALGVLTHGIITGVVPIAWGTSIDQAISMASSDAGLSLTLQQPPEWG